MSPGQLVSLWEVLHMLDLDAAPLLAAYGHVAGFSQILLNAPPDKPLFIRRLDLQSLKEHAIYLQWKLTSLELPMSAISAAAAVAVLTKLEQDNPGTEDYKFTVHHVVALRSPLDDIRTRLR